MASLDPPPATSTTSWRRALVWYVLLTGVAAGVFLYVRSVGEAIPRSSSLPTASHGEATIGTNSTARRVDVVAHVLASLAVVIALGQMLGRTARWLGQPAVVGEVFAGIVLGPSILGAISPAAMHALIPDAATDPGRSVPSALKAISQLGVVFHMFLVGLELNLAKVGRNAHAAIAISHSSILAPFVAGAALALWLFPTMAPEGVSFTVFALFLGSAMAITAFPVLARILADRGLDKTDLGAIALSCAATDDITAWCLLATVIGVAKSQISDALITIGLAVAFVGLMFAVIGPVARRLAARYDDAPEQGRSSLPWALAAVLGAALCTEAIGVHAVFGAFLLGAVLPHHSRLAADLKERLQTPVSALLLPAFFALTGMQTRIQLIDGWQAWATCGAIVLVATIGKYAGTLTAGMATGLGFQTSSALGVLMNTRGLMELIVLNVGRELGVIDERLYAMMVLMALATTVMTGPLLALHPRLSDERA